MPGCSVRVAGNLPNVLGALNSQALLAAIEVRW
jgi:hypothetical protein